MTAIQRGDFAIHYEITRPSDGPTLLLVAGLGEQIGSVEFSEEPCDAFAAHAFARAYRPEGVARLLRAAAQTPGLWQAQTQIACPTLVVHGGEDPCFGPEHARATSDRIKSAKLWLDPARGHIMHREQWDELAERVSALAG